MGHAANYIYPNDVIQTDPRIGSSAFLENNAKALWQRASAWPGIDAATDAGQCGLVSESSRSADNLGHRMNANAPFNSRLTVTGSPLLSIIPDPFWHTTPPVAMLSRSLRPPDWFDLRRWRRGPRE